MNGNTIRTFLGANSSQGFSSLYDTFAGTNKTIVIKGGPGSGKSSLMKKIAAEALKKGCFVEYCYCSSDAESLDAIRIPEKELCVLDGTSPHLIEPRFAGAMDEIIYTGQFWDGKKLEKVLPEIQDLTARIKECFSRAYRYLSAAGRATDDIRASIHSCTQKKQIKTFSENIIKRHTPNRKKQGEIFPRFLSGISPQGLIINRDTIYTLAEKVYVLQDSYCTADIFLDTAIETALERGQTVYVFYNPLCPSVPEHIALPEEGIAFVTTNKIHPFEPQNAYKIHMNRFSSPDKSVKDRCRNAEHLIGACLKEALDSLKKEKTYHDDLEEFYIEAMDFKKFNTFTEKLIKTLF